MKDILANILLAVVSTCTPILVTYLAKATKAWADKKALEIANAKAQAALLEINDIVSQAVTTTTQTYVDSLKASGSFDVTAQQTAFDKSRATIMSLLSAELQEFISSSYGNLALWVQTKIESTVKAQALETAATE